MRNFFKLLSPLLLAALFISCAQSVKQNGSISFDGDKIVSRAVQYTINKSRSPETGGDEEEFTPEMEEALKAALEFTATLSMDIKSSNNSYQDSVKEEYKVDYSKAAVFEKKNITFQNVPVGIKASINATITTKLAIKDESALLQLFELMDMPMEEFADFPAEELTEKLATAFDWGFTLYGKSELTVHEGENPVTLKMTVDPNGSGNGGEGGDDGIAIGGTIEPNIPQILTIKLNESASDSKVFLNKGTLAFKLLDEEGNEVTADSENPDLGNATWTYKLSLKNQVIPDSVSTASGNVVYYEASEREGKIEIENLPTAGTYQLYVQAEPTVTGYTDCATTSAMFDVVVIDSIFYSYNAANLMNGNAVSDEFKSFVDAITSNAAIKFSGATASDYAGVFESIRNYFTDDPVFQYLVDLDFSEMTTTISTDKYPASGYTVQDFVQLRSIIFPDDLPRLADADFARCTNLESVTFGSGIQQIGDGYDLVFMGCSSLKKVEFAKTDGWYNSSTHINVSSVDWSTLEAVDVSDPEANATHIKNGDWAYLYRKTE